MADAGAAVVREEPTANAVASEARVPAPGEPADASTDSSSSTPSL